MLRVPNQPGEQHGQVRPGQIVAKYHVTVIVADHDALLLQILSGSIQFRLGLCCQNRAGQGQSQYHTYEPCDFLFHADSSL